mmetsp:Transcript_166400/g.534517  ORF Transcript_166400/g.534517 Transcript_166400/m.534517 type:complete len:298 (+) Transcript_166400:528-1421(+)
MSGGRGKLTSSIITKVPAQRWPLARPPASASGRSAVLSGSTLFLGSGAAVARQSSSGARPPTYMQRVTPQGDISLALRSFSTLLFPGRCSAMQFSAIAEVEHSKTTGQSECILCAPCLPNFFSARWSKVSEAEAPEPPRSKDMSSRPCLSQSQIRHAVLINVAAIASEKLSASVAERLTAARTTWSSLAGVVAVCARAPQAAASPPEAITTLAACHSAVAFSAPLESTRATCLASCTPQRLRRSRDASTATASVGLTVPNGRGANGRECIIMSMWPHPRRMESARRTGAGLDNASKF